MKVRLQFDFTEDAVADLDDLSSRVGAVSRAETVRRALRLLDERTRADTGVDRIAAERLEQREKHGYWDDHDDDHDAGEIALVASLLAGDEHAYEDGHGYEGPNWGVDLKWKFAREQTNASATDAEGVRIDGRIHELTVAGALIAAEIDRLLRIRDG